MKQVKKVWMVKNVHVMRRLPETHATDPVSEGIGVAIETHTIDLEREASYKTKSQAG